MNNLIQDKGRWREGNVGIFKGPKIIHFAPPAKRVPVLMKNLYDFIKKDKNISWLLKACIFHYELEFIHPFTDGNGRMGRLWQQLLLTKENFIFKFITVEELIKENQKNYYDVLAQCDREGDSTKFIEFSLDIILSALENYRNSTSVNLKDASARLQYAKKHCRKRGFPVKNTWTSLKIFHQLPQAGI